MNDNKQTVTNKESLHSQSSDTCEGSRFSDQMPEFDLRPAHKGLLVNKVVFEQGVFQILRCLSVAQHAISGLARLILEVPKSHN
jgi:hypothetical protein